METQTYSSACILCSLNCGLKIEVETSTGKFIKITGDKEHPISKGYVCQKALRLDYYQNNTDRLTNPLKKMTDGSFQKISWEQAIQEVADKLVHIRNTYGGSSLAYSGGGGQGNHLQGGHGVFLRKSMDTKYQYTSLAQEKTGEWWVNGKLFGSQSCHVTASGMHHAEVAIFLGANPWEAHGVPQTRVFLKEIVNDSNRTLIVVDPRKTKSAEMADIHLQVKPGMDAFLLGAILGYIIQNNLEHTKFIEDRTNLFEEIKQYFIKIPVEKFANKCGIPLTQIINVANIIVKAKSVSTHHDLGLQQNLHSVLNSYFEKLLYLVTGNFGREGTNAFHSAIIPQGHSEPNKDGEYTNKTMVTGMFPIANIYPPNILPLEIDNDHPNRIRGVFIDSSNPVVTGADSQAYRNAFKKLELLVVIDVCMTETAKMADYILPASSQFEKYEASFFNLEFPANFFQLRHPIVTPKGDTLPESEIYRRLIIAMGDKAPEAVPEKNFPFMEAEARLATIPLYLGIRRLATQNKEAVAKAGIIPKEGQSLGDALFEKIVTTKSGTLITVHNYEDTWNMIRTEDKKIRLFIPELLTDMENLLIELETIDNYSTTYPLILLAGDRRPYTANCIYRNPEWRKQDPEGALYISSNDAKQHNLNSGDYVYVISERGKLKALVEISTISCDGLVSLPHSFGMTYDDSNSTIGPALNMLTSSNSCDPFAKTPYHKHVRVRLEKVAG